MSSSSDSEERIVVGAITVIYNTNVILVKSKKGKWIFPKGGVKGESKNVKINPLQQKDFESLQMACEREAFEEAGIIGTAELEVFCTKKNIKFFILKIHKILEDYPECETRERRLFKMEDALDEERVANYVKEIIEEFIKRKIEVFSDDSSFF